jgi:hypothetical protein
MRLGASAIVLVTLSFFGSISHAFAQVTSFEAAGNLKPTHDLECIGIEQVKNEYTPPDLMIAARKCSQVGRDEDAFVVWLVAGTYSMFDTFRVPDKSSHDAFQVLMMTYPLEKERPAVGAISKAYGAPQSPQMAKLCGDLKRIGPPSYYPAYMIRHGMGAFLGSAGVDKDFDAQKGWKDSLNKYLHCDVTDMH